MNSLNFKRTGLILLCLVANCVTVHAADKVTINLELKDLQESDSRVMHALHAYMKRLPDGDPVELPVVSETQKGVDGVMRKTWVFVATSLKHGSYEYEVGGKKNAVGKEVFLKGSFELRDEKINVEINLELKYNKICLQPRVNGKLLGLTDAEDVSVYTLAFERLGARGMDVEQLIERPLYSYKKGVRVAAFLPLYFVAPGRHRVTLYNAETLEKLIAIVEWPKVPAEECWIDFKSDNP